MASYRKKPVVIQACRIGIDGWPVWASQAFSEGKLLPAAGTQDIVIKTLEGDMLGRAGAWLIQGVKGELYACENDIFERTYEPA